MTTPGGLRESSQNSDEIDSLARFAVEEHNKKENAMLELTRVVKAQEQLVSGTLHHLTIEVADAGMKKLYEAKVWVKPWMDFKELQEFKHVGDVPAFAKSDLRDKKVHDPVIQDPAHHAGKTCQQRSNSLFPSELQESIHANAQVPSFLATPPPNGDIQMLPIIFPAFIPGSLPLRSDQEPMNRRPGLYAVPVLPFTGHIAGFPPSNLIPFTYSVPTGASMSGTGVMGEGQGQVGQQQPLQQQPPGPQRQVVVRRFQIAFQLDLLLILKLAAVIFLFNQDGSRQRLVLLVFFGSLIYLYQTGALAPLIRWLSQGMQRAAVPPVAQRAAPRADNAPVAERQGDENIAAADGQGEGENRNQLHEGNGAAENEHVVEPGQGEAGNRLWIIVKEIQMIVFGFITSLLPGFHNFD